MVDISHNCAEQQRKKWKNSQKNCSLFVLLRAFWLLMTWYTSCYKFLMSCHQHMKRTKKSGCNQCGAPFISLKKRKKKLFFFPPFYSPIHRSIAEIILPLAMRSNWYCNCEVFFFFCCFFFSFVSEWDEDTKHNKNIIFILHF